MTTRSADIDFLTLRNVTAYNKNNTFVSPGNIFSVSTNGETIWTSTIPSLYISTLSSNIINSSTINTNTLHASSIYSDNIEVSTINKSGNTVKISDVAAFNSTMYGDKHIINMSNIVNDDIVFGYSITGLTSNNNAAYGAQYQSITGNTFAIGQDITIVSTTGVNGNAAGIVITTVKGNGSARGISIFDILSKNGNVKGLQVDGLYSQNSSVYGITHDIINSDGDNAYGYYISTIRSSKSANGIYINNVEGFTNSYGFYMGRVYSDINSAYGFYMNNINSENDAYGLYLGDITSDAGKAYGIYQAYSTATNIFQGSVGIKRAQSTLRATLDIEGNQFIGPNSITNNSLNAITVLSTVMNSPVSAGNTVRGIFVRDTIATSLGSSRGIEVRSVTSNTNTSIGMYVQNVRGSNSYGSLIADIASDTSDSFGTQITTIYGSVNSYGTYIDSITAGSGNAYGIYIGNNIITPGLAYGIYQASNTALNYFAGKVGINNNTPNRELTVGCDASISGNLFVDNISSNLIVASTISGGELLSSITTDPGLTQDWLPNINTTLLVSSVAGFNIDVTSTLAYNGATLTFINNTSPPTPLGITYTQGGPVDYSLAYNSTTKLIYYSTTGIAEWIPMHYT